MIPLCHGRIRIPDESGRRYMCVCYTCGRFDHWSELWPGARMKPPAFTAACPLWVRKPERNLAEESWSEEPPNV